MGAVFHCADITLAVSVDRKHSLHQRISDQLFLLEHGRKALPLKALGVKYLVAAAGLP